MSGNQLVTYERNLNSLQTTFADVLTGSGIAPERLIRTVLISLERTPKLMECSQQTVINAAVTFGVLGLEVDGVTGQGFMIPFRERAQPIIGYKGYNTLAARSGISIKGAVVREGDVFEFDLAAADPIRHTFDMFAPGRLSKRIVGAWALGVSKDRPAVPAVMTIDELLDVKASSPGARKSDSPWNNEKIGFPAMCEKTVKRRLARAMPLNVMQHAAAMEEAFEERGKYSYISKDKGVVVDGDFRTVGDTQPPAEDEIMTERGAFTVFKPSGAGVPCNTIEEWRGKMLRAIEAMQQAEQLSAFRRVNGAEMARLYDDYERAVSDVDSALRAKERAAKGE